MRRRAAVETSRKTFFDDASDDRTQVSLSDADPFEYRSRSRKR